MNIIFFGTPEFAAYSLKAIHDAGHNIMAVVTAPDKPAGRGHRLLQSAVKQAALSLSLPVLQPTRLKDQEFVDTLRALNADAFVVIAFRMLPEVVWSMPRLGTFNLHASLLPAYRGAAPINRAIINGDTVTGLTTFRLTHEIDTGDILLQQELPILPDENVGSLHDRMMTLGADLMLRSLRALEEGTATFSPQAGTPTPAPKLTPENMTLLPGMSALEMHNLIRGLSPYPAARIDVPPLGTLKVYESRITDAPSVTPGQVNSTPDGRLMLHAADRQLQLLRVQAPGKRPMAADELLRGLRGII